MRISHLGLSVTVNPRSRCAFVVFTTGMSGNADANRRQYLHAHAEISSTPVAAEGVGPAAAASAESRRRNTMQDFYAPSVSDVALTPHLRRRAASTSS